MKHELKCLPQYFQAVWVGDKTFEIRLNDRNFKERDEVVLQEWDGEDYTQRSIEGIIRYLTDFQQQPNYVVFSVEATGKFE